MCVHVVVHLSLRINKNDNQKPAGKNKNKKKLLQLRYDFNNKIFLFLIFITIDYRLSRVIRKKIFSYLESSKNIKLSIRDSAKCTVCKNKFSKINSRV